jgi:hypothetical protein
MVGTKKWRVLYGELDVSGTYLVEETESLFILYEFFFADAF